MKRRFRAVLLLLLFLSLPFALFAAPSSEKTPRYTGMLRLFSNPEARSPVMLKENDELACYFKIKSPIIGIAVEAPSYSNNIGDMTLSVYRWKGNLDDSLSDPELASETFENFTDNSSLSFYVKLKPGAYVWVADRPREKVGLWKSPEKPAGTKAFQNGEPVSDGCWLFSYLFPADTPFIGTPGEYQYLKGLPKTAPAEPDDDPALTKIDVMPDTWDAVDELGRSLPNSADTGPVRKGKQVGIFYWTWHEKARTAADGKHGPYDITKIITEHPEAVGDVNHPAWGPLFAPHHWSEPLFGYYTTCDPWVLRHHAELLADAGVDAAIFDCTNGTFTWMDSVVPLMEIWSKARADGVRAPKVAFMLPFFDLNYTAESLRQIYRDIYAKNYYPDTWFYWEGKPLVIGNPDAIKRLIPKADGAEKEELEKILGFFTFRAGQPAYVGGPTRSDQWGWLEVFPQNPYVKRTDGSCEMVTVGVAQNHSLNPLKGAPGLHAMNDRGVFGRGYVAGETPSSKPDAWLEGGNFAQQWGRAFELDPDFVFVTGWNEWVAGRHDVWQQLPNAFPDQYNEEFSRDCEPERGKLMDTFYLQLASNIRRFKGTRKLPAPSPAKTIDMNGSWTEWKDVKPEYRDYRGDIPARDFDGYGGVHYTSDTGRNDIVLCKTARDDENLYFFVETNDQLAPFSGTNWMRLLIGVPARAKAPNWKGFSYLVEQTKEKAVLMEYSGKNGSWEWKPVADLVRKAGGKRLAVAVPRELLHLDGKKTDIRFKWSDNMQTDGDVLDFYVNGDTAPDGRFSYRYKD